MKLRRPKPRDDGGAAMVEFAIIFPILILLVIGIINFAYLMGQQLEVNSAARQGGRAAVVSLPTGVSAQTKASTAVANATGHLVPAGKATVSYSGTICGTPNSIGKEMKVKVTYSNPGFLVSVPIFPVSAPASLTSEAVFRCEW